MGRLCTFIADATVNREKGPKMKMAQEVLRHFFVLSCLGSQNHVGRFLIFSAPGRGLICLGRLAGVADSEDFPLMGAVPKNRRLTRQGYRILIVDNYLVFYVLLDNETVEIRRIVSGKRDYKFLF